MHSWEETERLSAPVIRDMTEGLLEDIIELERHMGVTVSEREWAKSRGESQVQDLSGLSDREAAIAVLAAAAALGHRSLEIVDSEPLIHSVICTLVGQKLLTKAVGSRLGLQLSRRADVKLDRIQRGAAEGGRKGAATRRQKSISPADVTRRAQAFGWPDKVPGLNKTLSRVFECSPDHIGRILRKATSDT